MLLQEAILDAEIHQEEDFDSWVAEQENVQRIRVNGKEYVSKIKREAILRKQSREEAALAAIPVPSKEERIENAQALLDNLFSALGVEEGDE